MLVTGATGFVGQKLVATLLGRGDEVTVFSRNGASAKERLGAGEDRLQGADWSPLELGDWRRDVDGHDAVVHLAGEPAVGKRWTDKVKHQILQSRTLSTGNLVRAMAEVDTKPRVFVCASAVGYYGHSDAAALDESAPAGDDFLAQVCVGWEAAAKRAEELGIRVVSARIGIVLGSGGGALGEMVKPFKAFVGGPIGSGKQMVSWIDADDLVRGLVFCIDDDRARGPVNFSAPEPVSNATLAKKIGEVLGRPSFMRAPASALRLRFGEGADPLLTGQAAVPKKLLDYGFEFETPGLRDSLARALD